MVSNTTGAIIIRTDVVPKILIVQPSMKELITLTCTRSSVSSFIHTLLGHSTVAPVQPAAEEDLKVKKKKREKAVEIEPVETDADAEADEIEESAVVEKKKKSKKRKTVEE